MTSRILINCTNLHTGGGVQVATSFIQEATSGELFSSNYSVWVSSEVHRNLVELSIDTVKLNDYQVVDTYGMKMLFSKVAREMDNFDLVFTVFGPLYTMSRRFKSVMGFAQPWIIYPNGFPESNYINRLRNRLKFSIQAWFFRRADHVVVELDHVKQRLVEQQGFSARDVSVVLNCASSIYRTGLQSDYETSQQRPKDLTLGFLGRDYPHKNTKQFPVVAKILREKFGIEARFKVTFTDEEWRNLSPEFKSVAENVGVLRVDECPGFYKAVDAVIFPSLLECFSATPVEGMSMGKPVFLSDRGFNRDICREFGYYFDPLDPVDIAKVIAENFDGMLDQTKLESARAHAIALPGPEVRANKYIQCIESMCN